MNNRPSQPLILDPSSLNHLNQSAYINNAYLLNLLKRYFLLVIASQTLSESERKYITSTLGRCFREANKKHTYSDKFEVVTGFFSNFRDNKFQKLSSDPKRLNFLQKVLKDAVEYYLMLETVDYLIKTAKKEVKLSDLIGDFYYLDLPDNKKILDEVVASTGQFLFPEELKELLRGHNLTLAGWSVLVSGFDVFGIETLFVKFEKRKLLDNTTRAFCLSGINHFHSVVELRAEVTPYIGVHFYRINKANITPWEVIVSQSTEPSARFSLSDLRHVLTDNFYFFTRFYQRAANYFSPKSKFDRIMSMIKELKKDPQPTTEEITGFLTDLFTTDLGIRSSEQVESLLTALAEKIPLERKHFIEQSKYQVNLFELVLEKPRPTESIGLIRFVSRSLMPKESKEEIKDLIEFFGVDQEMNPENKGIVEAAVLISVARKEIVGENFDCAEDAKQTAEIIETYRKKIREDRGIKKAVLPWLRKISRYAEDSELKREADIIASKFSLAKFDSFIQRSRAVLDNELKKSVRLENATLELMALFSREDYRVLPRFSNWIIPKYADPFASVLIDSFKLPEIKKLLEMDKKPESQSKKREKKKKKDDVIHQPKPQRKRGVEESKQEESESETDSEDSQLSSPLSPSSTSSIRQILASSAPSPKSTVDDVDFQSEQPFAEAQPPSSISPMAALESKPVIKQGNSVITLKPGDGREPYKENTGSYEKLFNALVCRYLASGTVYQTGLRVFLDYDSDFDYVMQVEKNINESLTNVMHCFVQLGFELENTNFQSCLNTYNRFASVTLTFTRENCAPVDFVLTRDNPLSKIDSRVTAQAAGLRNIRTGEIHCFEASLTNEIALVTQKTALELTHKDLQMMIKTFCRMSVFPLDKNKPISISEDSLNKLNQFFALRRDEVTRDGYYLLDQAIFTLIQQKKCRSHEIRSFISFMWTLDVEKYRGIYQFFNRDLSTRLPSVYPRLYPVRSCASVLYPPALPAQGGQAAPPIVDSRVGFGL